MVRKRTLRNLVGDVILNEVKDLLSKLKVQSTVNPDCGPANAALKSGAKNLFLRALL
jgi:hypothetical protein